MNYAIDRLSAADLRLIGEALDAMPHGKVSGLVGRIQQQINLQEIAERDRDAAEREGAAEQWRVAEAAKLKAEIIAAAKPPKSKKGT